MGCIYRNTGMNAQLSSESMLYAMAEALAHIFQGAYIMIAPIIGLLGGMTAAGPEPLGLTAVRWVKIPPTESSVRKQALFPQACRKQRLNTANTY